MGTTIALVSCVKSKQSVPAPAGELYTSALFKGLRSYALANSDAWYILSAEHGLLKPDRIIEPYERTLNRMPRAEQAQWAARVWNQLRPVLAPNTRVILLAGTNYRRDLVPLLRGHGCEISIPFEGLSFGRQLARLKALSETGFRDD
jgi:cytoplasmic iron level regulating protein YaaA (DUF328/UPF0246 family)